MSVESILALVEAQRFPGWRPSTAIPGFLMREVTPGVWEHVPTPISGSAPDQEPDEAPIGATPTRDALSLAPAPSGDLLERMTQRLSGRLFNDRKVV